MRPFSPQVDAGGLFDEIRDVRTADTPGNFEEVDAMVGVGFQEFGVGDAAHKIQTLNHLLIEFF